MPTTPILPDPTKPRSIWSIDEIYTGPDGVGPYVPNVNNAVIDVDQGLFKVVAVDPLTNLSTLEARNFNNNGGGLLQEDVLLASGPNAASEAWRIYFNPDSNPISLHFDAALRIYSNTASYVKVFRGTDIGPTGHVISAIYDNTPAVVSENIPLQLVVMPGVSNVAVKSPAPGSSVEPIPDGETLTVVVYSDTDDIVYIRRMIAKNTNLVHSTDEDRLFVASIELLSPFLSLTDSHLLEYPFNLLLQSGTLQGKVTYSDGTTAIFPVDGTRFSLLGMNTYIANEEGQRVDLYLRYTLQPNEFGMAVSPPLPGRYMLEHYTLTTVGGLGEYNVKLFVVPKWNGGTNTWNLDYYLYNLDRDILHFATPHVENIPSTPLYDGTLINSRQSVTVAVNLSALDPMYLNYRFPMNFAIQLKAQGTNNLANTFFIMEYQEGVFYGSGVFATSQPDPANNLLRRVKIDLNMGTVEDWLEKVYNPLKVLKTPVETSPPLPTHVRVKIGNSWQRELAIADVINPIDGINVATPQATLVRLEFIRRENTDLELGIASMIVRT